jgi:hypothetical protein
VHAGPSTGSVERLTLIPVGCGAVIGVRLGKGGDSAVNRYMQVTGQGRVSAPAHSPGGVSLVPCAMTYPEATLRIPRRRSRCLEADMSRETPVGGHTRWIRPGSSGSYVALFVRKTCPTSVPAGAVELELGPGAICGRASITAVDRLIQL